MKPARRKTPGTWAAAVLLAAGLAPALAPAAASATESTPLWGYVDGAGTAHFASQALDSRYSPVLRGPHDEVGKVPGKSMVRASLLTWLEFAPEVKAVQPLLREAARLTGVDTELLQAIIVVESGYRGDLVSPRGALGLMQITPATADRYAPRAELARQGSEQLLRDPRLNVLTGARMLADLARRFGGVDVALAAWNAGEGSVRRFGGKVPPFAETQAHVHLVLELYWALLQQRQQRSVRGISVAAAPALPAR